MERLISEKHPRLKPHFQDKKVFQGFEKKRNIFSQQRIFVGLASILSTFKTQFSELKISFVIEATLFVEKTEVFSEHLGCFMTKMY